VGLPQIKSWPAKMKSFLPGMENGNSTVSQYEAPLTIVSLLFVSEIPFNLFMLYL
jgi:hypothetical protein